MLINFNQIPETVTPHMRGGEGQVVSRTYLDKNIKIARGLLAPGCTIGLHTHETNSEVICILSGTGKVLCDGEFELVSAGSVHYCPKGHDHSLINDSQGDLTYFAVIPEHGV